MLRCRFFCAVISRDFRNLRQAFFLSSHLSLFFSLFRIVLRRESEHLKAVRFISMLIYICIFARFFQHFRDFHFLPLTHLASAYPYTRCSCVKFRKRQFFSLFLSLLPSLLFDTPPRYSLLSPASFLPNSVNTWWILRYYFFFLRVLDDSPWSRIHSNRDPSAKYSCQRPSSSRKIDWFWTVVIVKTRSSRDDTSDNDTSNESKKSELYDHDVAQRGRRRRALR